MDIDEARAVFRLFLQFAEEARLLTSGRLRGRKTTELEGLRYG
jgi:hypothetical protein